MHATSGPDGDDHHRCRAHEESSKAHELDQQRLRLQPGRVSPHCIHVVPQRQKNQSSSGNGVQDAGGEQHGGAGSVERGAHSDAGGDAHGGGAGKGEGQEEGGAQAEAGVDGSRAQSQALQQLQRGRGEGERLDVPCAVGGGDKKGN